MSGRSPLLTACGSAGLAGCLSMLIGNVAGVLVVERHDPISDTISNLAAGPHAWIQDAALILLASGMLACGAGMLRWSLGGWAWRLAAALLIVAAADVALIAAHNEYGDRDSEKYVIHTQLVYGLGVLFPAIAVLAADGLRRLGQRWARASLTAAVAWAALSPLFFLTPTAWDGAYERLIGLILLGWLAMLSWLMVRHGGRPAAA